MNRITSFFIWRYVTKVIAFGEKALSLLGPNDRKKVIQTIPILVSLSLLDLAGVVLLGTVATLTFNLISNDSKPTRLEMIFQDIAGTDISRTTLIIIFSLMAVFLLSLKTLSQAFFSLRFAKFQARLETDIASKLYNNLISSGVSKINTNKFSDYHYSLIVGANRYVTGMLGSSVTFISDVFTAVLMFSFAFYASPLSAIVATTVFLGSYLIFNGPVNSRARIYGKVSMNSYLNLGEDLLESLRGIREIKAYSKETMYEDKFREEKTTSSLVNQKIMWLNGLVKYFLEMAILLAGTLITISLVITTDLKHAITVAVLFLVIGFRLIPIIQRLQNSVNSIRISNEATKTLFQYFEEFKNLNNSHKNLKNGAIQELECIEVQNVAYSFSDGSIALSEITFKIRSNQTLAIFGDSGAGKSTLLDLVTGLSSPTSGTIQFHSTTEGIQYQPGVYPISFITQNCALFGNDIYQNVSLSKELSDVDRLKVDQIVDTLNLEKFIESEVGKSREIRSDSTNISGGERQRIAIARAKFFDTSIVVLDEPTSALDAENERRVVEYLEEIFHKKTVIFITHSESLLNVADLVLYLKEGKMMFFGGVSDFRGWKSRL